MKRLIMFFVAAMVAFSFATVGFAGGDHKISGEITKVEGDMVTIKDEKAKSIWFTPTRAPKCRAK